MDGMENLGEPGPTKAARPALLDVQPEQLQSWMQTHGEPPMRARQLRRWLFAGRAESFEEMTDLPRGLRQLLADDFVLLGTRLARTPQAGDATPELLLRLHD